MSRLFIDWLLANGASRDGGKFAAAPSAAKRSRASSLDFSHIFPRSIMLRCSSIKRAAAPAGFKRHDCALPSPPQLQGRKRSVDPLNNPPQGERRAAPPAAEMRFIRLQEVLKICGKSRSSVYEAIQKGEFPKPVKLRGRSSGWIKSEVELWVQACIKASRTE